MNTQKKDEHHIEHKPSVSKEKNTSKGHIKRESAEALDEHQWHKHPGGG